MENKREGYRRNPLRDLIVTLEKLDKKGVIGMLSIQSSGINANSDYTFVSFKIPRY